MAQGPPQQPPAEEQNLLLSKFAGLKNTVTRERLGPDELERAINVDLTDVGQIRRRRGFQQFGTWNTPCHSLYRSDTGTVFVATLNAGAWHLVEVLPDGLRTGPNFAAVGPDRIGYTQIGDKIYYTSRTAAGIIDLSGTDATFGPWSSGGDVFLSPVINPTANLPAIRGRLLGSPPLAEYLADLNGRIYLGHDRLVWATELFDYLHVDKTKGFWQFEADITGIGSVTDGLYIGTTNAVYFVTTPTHRLRESTRVKVMDTGMIPGTLCYIPSELANPSQVPLNQETDNKIAVLFMTHRGYCGGQDGGTCYNFTEDKVIFPRAESGAATFRQQDGINQFLAVLNSVGGASSGAAIGDYVEATLIRGGGWNTLADQFAIADQFTVWKNGVLSP